MLPNTEDMQNKTTLLRELEDDGILGSLLSSGKTYEEIASRVLEDYDVSITPLILEVFLNNNSRNKPRLAIVVPCKNEEDGIPETIKRLHVLLDDLMGSKKISEESFLCFVDDGSSDTTWSIIQEENKKSKKVRGIKLSRNFGHQNALYSGLSELSSQAEVFISMDADLQDDLSIIETFIDKYRDEQCEIVYGVRRRRDADTFLKKKTAEMFYSFQGFMGIETVYNHADYRLMSQKAVKSLLLFDEADMFLRGLVPLVGYKSAVVQYDRGERFAGISKYPFRKMFFFALDGITSFSMKPLRVITIIGFFVFLFSFIAIAWVMFERFVLGSTIQGWSSMMVSLYFSMGVQMISLGIIGEYVGRIFKQSKSRPKFIVERSL